MGLGAWAPQFLSRIAEVGTPFPAVTRQVAAPGTWAVLVPRNCFTPSLMRLKPWTYASLEPASASKGQPAPDLPGARPPVYAAPSPRPQKP